jgi:hypothetical protein
MSPIEVIELMLKTLRSDPEGLSSVHLEIECVRCLLHFHVCSEVGLVVYLRHLEGECRS